jgi:hypothetical protein
LADTLYDAQSLGLALNGPHALADYQALRRADGGTMAATTHFLAEIFSGPKAASPRPWQGSAWHSPDAWHAQTRRWQRGFGRKPMAARRLCHG